MKQYYVYILASRKNGVLYIGITNDLSRRVQEHIDENTPGFTKEYHVHHLVYYETYDSSEDAIRREKNMKAWKRAWKVQLIEEHNADWKDLAATLLD